jgi:hypothetical protein
MKNLFVSAGLVAIGAAGLQTAVADLSDPKYWNVSATLRGFYDSNYSVNPTQQGSYGIEFLPGVSFHVPLQQTDMGIRYNYGLYWYQQRAADGLNPYDQTHEVDLWLDHAFNERWHAKVTDTFASGQEPELLNPNPTTANAVPWRINGNNLSNHGALALNTDWTRLFSTVLTYNNTWFDYANNGATVDSSGNIVPNGPTYAGLLNRIEQNIPIDFQWHIQQETTIFAGYAFSMVNYTGNEPIAVVSQTTASFNGVYYSADRDTRTQYGYLGIQQQFTPNLSMVLRAGASATDTYNDPLYPGTTISPYADLSISYTYIPGSYVQLGFTEDVSPTDVVAPNSQGQITQFSTASVVYFDVNHQFTKKLTGTAIVRAQFSNFQGGAASSSTQTDYGLGLNLTYQINQFLAVDAGYNYDYYGGVTGFYSSANRNRVYLGLIANY